MEEQGKGTVTSFASMFPAREAQKAAKKVEDAVAEKQKGMAQLKEFVADNTNLINLVSRLPNELHHDIMVPFGKAAFFPGRLIHTNEFMVLLGEGYYVERTAKQTVEILKRRGKALDAQVQSLKSNMEDLKAEALFFDTTASEAVEGLVEIREDYVEDDSVKKQSKSDDRKVTMDDVEYSRLMSRLDELEKEELAAEAAMGSDDEEPIDTSENDKDGLAGAAGTDSGSDAAYLEAGKPEHMAKAEYTSKPAEELLSDFQHRLKVSEGSNCTGLTVQSLPEDERSRGKGLTYGVEKSPSADKHFMLPEAREKINPVSSSTEAFTGSIVDHTENIQRISEQTVASLQKDMQTSKPPKPGFDISKAFTGSIVERTHNLQTSQGQNATSSQSTKPVSRFKMRRR